MSSNGNGSTLLCNLEVEQVLLSAMLRWQDVVDEVAPMLAPGDFYEPANAVIFEAIQGITAIGESVDHVTVADWLEGQRKIDTIGGRSTIFNLIDTEMPTAGAILTYVGIIKDYSKRRQCQDMVQRAYYVASDRVHPVDATLNLLEKDILGLVGTAGNGCQTFFEGIADLRQHLENLSLRTGDTTGTPTGFVDLDRLTAGFHPGEMIVMAARPSVGKSALALNFCRRMAEQGFHSLFFSLETGRQQLLINIQCAKTFTDSYLIRSGKASKETLHKVSSDIGCLDKIHVNDDSAMTPALIRAKANQQVKTFPIKLIVVDYLQLMSMGTPYENRALEVAAMSRALKVMAKDFQIPVLAISQLNRLVEAREGGRPRLSDLRESGAIEQDADTVMLLYRADYGKPPDGPVSPTDVIVAKQRNGPVGSVTLGFNRHCLRFDNLQPQSEKT